MTTSPGSGFDLPKPTSCLFWEHPEKLGLGRPFECVENLVDERHLSRSILKCHECGRLYFYEFYEVVDWKDGNDKQYTSYFPVDSPEQIEALKASSVFEIYRFTPRLIDKRWIGK
jgi:hypothetical protein